MIRFDRRFWAAAGAVVLAAGVAAVVLSGDGGASTPDKIDAGTLSCTTDANGYCAAQPHGLGSVPVSVVATSKAPIAGACTVQTLDADSFTAVSFRIRAFKANGSALAACLISYSYAAFSGPAPTPTPTPTVSTSTSASPSPTVTTSAPPQTSNCAPNPHLCGYPDATNTGADTSVAMQTVPGQVTSGTGWHWDTRGWVTIDGDGAVFSNYIMTTGDGIDVTASNVTISNDVLTLQGDIWAIGLRHTTGVTIDRCTISSPIQNGAGRLQEGIRGIYGDDDAVTITHNNIFHADSGINHLDQGGLIADNYIHDMGYNSGDHINGIQLGAGLGPLMTIRHNTILNQLDQTDAVMLATDDGPETNRVIDNNLLAGGGYTFYGAGGPSDIPTQEKVTNNRFSRIFFPNGGFYGPVAYFVAAGAGNVWTGNVWDDNNAPVSAD
jgi:hypothetical protein